MEVERSFRDPAGFSFSFNNRFLRLVRSDNVSALETFLSVPCTEKFMADQRLISTRRLPVVEQAALREEASLHGFISPSDAGQLFEHARVFFPSFPYEWPAEMLLAAGRVTLELAQESLSEGYGLKDATPYNVLFRGPQPVFIDVLSFERREAGDPVWKPYAQFVRTFVLPLLVNQRWGIRLADVFTTRRDGLEPEEVYRLCGPVQKCLPPVLSLVSLPTWLSRKANHADNSLYQSPTLGDPDKARFILQSLFHRLRKALEALQPKPQRESVWANYMSSHSYSEAGFAGKQQFVEKVLQEFKPQRVLDLGANTGHFSALAAQAGAQVVAVDSDPACAGAIWRLAHEKRLDILPLVMDVGRPSSGLGWRNRECAPFLERATNAFDLVFMLAVIHHLLVTERVPLKEIVSLAADLSRDLVILEYVSPQDSMFRRLTRGRDHLHADLNPEVFEQECRQRFDIVRSAPVPDTSRRLYLLRKKGSAT